MANRDLSRSEFNRRSVCVSLHVYDDLRQSVGQAQLDVEMSMGSRVEDLLRHMAQMYGERFMDACLPMQRERSTSVIILNGRALVLPEGLHQELRSGDELYLIPPIAGG